MRRKLSPEELVEKAKREKFRSELNSRGFNLYKKEEKLIATLIQEKILSFHQVKREGLLMIELNPTTRLTLRMDGYTLSEDGEETTRFFRLKDDYTKAIQDIIHHYSS